MFSYGYVEGKNDVIDHDDNKYGYTSCCRFLEDIKKRSISLYFECFGNEIVIYQYCTILSPYIQH